MLKFLLILLLATPVFAQTGTVDKTAPTHVQVVGFAQGGNIVIPRVDPSTESLQTITYEHHEIHAGSHFEIVDVVDLAINNVRDLQIVTPNTTKWTHLTFTITCESETEWFLYENVTISTAGTADTPHNNNRNSATIAGTAIAYIDNTSVANANADTVVGGATELEHGICGSGRDAGANRRDKEIILKQNEDHSLRLVANAAGYVNYDIEFYEHTNAN